LLVNILKKYFFKKNIFLTSANQNDPKPLKIINLKQKKKSKFNNLNTKHPYMV
jgi:hypothetical protein